MFCLVGPSSLVNPWSRENWGVVTLYKKEKKDILSKLEQLDKKAESTLLLPHDINIKQCLNAQLIQLLWEEEIK
jgi:hypothetical protein